MDIGKEFSVTSNNWLPERHTVHMHSVILQRPAETEGVKLLDTGNVV